MRLKKVRIFGFKTFADRTELDINGDLCSIVGPNGCGKSNIVDAMMWGLGEPNARSLRAATSQDVIFNGSAKRKPLGYAEVTLIFDNEDGSLPLDTAEVAITRRLTRSGDSQFQINRKNCRLKDIYDLLADSGLGRAGYSIVGQREIDQALSASPEDRRAWIDEAAGVQRFRAKRQESVRRLDSAKDHLNRIDQILADIQYQREPLAEEAELAKKYLVLKNALTEIESGFLMHEVAEAVAQSDALIKQIAEGALGAERETLRAEELRIQLAVLGDEIAETERKLDAFRELRQSQLTEIERAQSEVKLREARKASLNELEENLHQEHQHSEETGAKATQERVDSEAELNLAKGVLDSLQSATGTEESRMAELRAELKALDIQISSAREVAAKNARMVAESAQAESRLGTIRAELVAIQSDILPVETEILSAKADAEAKQSTLNELVAGRQIALEQIQSAQSETVEIGRAARELATQLATLEAKKRGLEATLESHDGLSQGSLAVLDLVRSGELKSVYKPVGEAVVVEPDLATAIEIALGAAVHDLIVPHEEDAKAAIQKLKDRRAGRATFQPLNRIRPYFESPELRKLASQKGSVGIASDLVTVDDEYRPVIQSLLGKILVVETIDDGLRLGKSGGYSRIVTLDGEVIHSAGAVTGGKSSRHTSGIVHRRAEHGQLEVQIEELEARIRTTATKLEERDSNLKAAQATLAASEERVALAKQELDESQTWVRRLEQELAATVRERDRLAKECDHLENQRKVEIQPEVDEAQLAESRNQVIESIAKLSADSDAAKEKLLDARRRYEHAVDRRRRAEEALMSVEERAKSRANRIQNIEVERSKIAGEITDAMVAESAAKAKLAEFTDSVNAQSELKKKQLESSFDINDEIKKAEQNAHNFASVIHRFEIDRARADSKRANASQRLAEVYGITEEEALLQAPSIEIPPDAMMVAGRLRRDLRALGDVNVGAIETYNRLTERFEELSAQRADVFESVEEVLAVVKELDRMTRDKFLTTFEQVNLEFKSQFSLLFGGGQASLKLTESDSVLTAGVEVEVQVPGKKTQRLELLSGGERSLSAVAFLFSLLRVKPSPLVVLDEVDAPLDGRNVERFVDALRTFKGITQFLIITHNPVTIEAADIWFGVTMQEPGCSTIVPCKFDDTRAVVPDQFLTPQSV